MQMFSHFRNNSLIAIIHMVLSRVYFLPQYLIALSELSRPVFSAHGFQYLKHVVLGNPFRAAILDGLHELAVCCRPGVKAARHVEAFFHAVILP